MITHPPRKRFGQNFLTDTHYIQKIVASIHPQPGQQVVEIGPGRGALTQPLASSGAVLHVIEIDRDLITALAASLPATVVIHAADVLRFDFEQLPRPMRIVGNLPYNISSPILFRLIASIERIADIHVMLQKEVVERMVAPPGNKVYGRLSVMLQYHFDLKKLFDVPAGAFFPAPKVVSSVVRLTPKKHSTFSTLQYARFTEVVMHAFNQRRKTLRNALSGLISVAQLEAAQIDAGARAEQLHVEDFVRLVKISEPV